MTPDVLIAVVTFTLLMAILLVAAWWGTRDNAPKREDPRAEAVIRKIEEDEEG